jgi:hypothetical protein
MHQTLLRALFGRQGKVLIFDEVLAYEAYLYELFYRLLKWLTACGVSVILLPYFTCAGGERLSRPLKGYNLRTGQGHYPCMTLVRRDLSTVLTARRSSRRGHSTG